MAKNIFQRLYHYDLERAYMGFPGVIFDNVIGNIPDLQTYFEGVRKELSLNTKILISYHNPLWEPILNLASSLGLRKSVGIQNWLDQGDLKNILELSGFKVLRSQLRFFGITSLTIAKPVSRAKSSSKNYSVSIVIPARNEAGNIPKIIPSIPHFGRSQEFVFVEGGSKDKTWEAINKQIYKYTKGQIVVRALRQKGKGKADAVWEGLKNASGEILMIYDADRTVDPKDLPKFYDALAPNPKAFTNGNRLLYPMKGDAMQTLNHLGNQIFSWLFTTILGQRFKDTLCGTKAFWAADFKKFKRSGADPFGDFDLIFGAVRRKLKVIEIPVRYRERVYGTTNINRFYHGLLLLKMTVLALLEFKL